MSHTTVPTRPFSTSLTRDLLVSVLIGFCITLVAHFRRLAAELSPREFVALAYARFDPADGTLALANAGLPDPYLLPLSGPAQAVVVPGPRLPLGVRREVEYRSEELTLAPGERLLWRESDGEVLPRSGDGLPRCVSCSEIGAGGPETRAERPAVGARRSPFARKPWTVQDLLLSS